MIYMVFKGNDGLNYNDGDKTKGHKRQVKYFGFRE